MFLEGFCIVLGRMRCWSLDREIELKSPKLMNLVNITLYKERKEEG